MSRGNVKTGMKLNILKTCIAVTTKTYSGHTWEPVLHVATKDN